MSNVLQFPRKDADIDQKLQARWNETDSLTMLLINDGPVRVRSIVYIMNDVFADIENSEDLRGHLINLLQASEDQEPECVSRLNRFLIAGARELAFSLTADIGHQQKTSCD